MMCDRQKECLACTNRSCMMAGIEDPEIRRRMWRIWNV